VADRLTVGVAARLSRYLQVLTQARKMGKVRISSQEIAEYTNINATQIRRDLSAFGKFGKRGVGYNIDSLLGEIRKILRTQGQHNIALIGAGRLGQAIASSPIFAEHGINIAAVFDTDAEKIGVPIGHVTVSEYAKLPDSVRDKNIIVGVLAVPASAAQRPADDLLEHRTDVRRADEDGVGAGECLRPPPLQLGPPAHRVLELGTVRLHRVARAGRGRDGAAEQHVVREYDVRRQQLAHERCVGLDVAFALIRREVLQQPGLETLVAVEHEHRQQPVGQLRHEDARAADVVPLRMPLLADDGDVVARVAPLARERTRVDVGARTSEEVPVPEDDLQVRWK